VLAQRPGHLFELHATAAALHAPHRVAAALRSPRSEYARSGVARVGRNPAQGGCNGQRVLELRGHSLARQAGFVRQSRNKNCLIDT
jgi:hypothetical protein